MGMVSIEPDFFRGDIAEAGTLCGGGTRDKTASEEELEASLEDDRGEEEVMGGGRGAVLIKLCDRLFPDKEVTKKGEVTAGASVWVAGARKGEDVRSWVGSTSERELVRS